MAATLDGMGQAEPGEEEHDTYHPLTLTPPSPPCSHRASFRLISPAHTPREGYTAFGMESCARASGCERERESGGGRGRGWKKGRQGRGTWGVRRTG